MAAHNGQDSQRSFPGSLPFVHDANPDVRAWFARQEQFSTRAGGGYQVFFGSSMSAAGITGIAALLRTHSSGPETETMIHDLLRDGCPAAVVHDTPLRTMIADASCAN